MAKKKNKVEKTVEEIVETVPVAQMGITPEMESEVADVDIEASDDAECVETEYENIETEENSILSEVEEVIQDTVSSINEVSEVVGKISESFESGEASAEEVEEALNAELEKIGEIETVVDNKLAELDKLINEKADNSKFTRKTNMRNVIDTWNGTYFT